MRSRTEISLSAEQRQALEAWTRRSTIEQRYSQRAHMILLLDEGLSNVAIAARLHTRAATVSKWRRRFAEHGLEGIYDLPRAGQPPKYDARTDKRVLSLLDEDAPSGYSQWNGRLIAEALGDVPAHRVWAILRTYKISLARQRSWCVSTDPEFARKAADIVALYLDPPENAVVLSVDEKPAIQALERAQGWLKLPNGRALSGFSHEYKRHGTTTLFAALDVATGRVKADHFKRRRRPDFLRFMNSIIAEYDDRQIHVILDNLSTHKPKNDQWLRRHKNVHFHFTPTHASWLNQIECWFSILHRSTLRKGSFTSIHELRHAIDRFIEAYDKTATPFEWTKTTVKPGPLKKTYANLVK